VSGTDGQENRTHIRKTGQSFQANEIAGLKVSNVYDMEQRQEATKSLAPDET
jgi:hypothetical protein